ncbi:UvrD-helicase domain-containing protein [Sulfitobacter sp. R18_1]|uniref:UvrD-helicase domain-containing protein n=1 Tax=Sulfitobacter sp. R18_1 TaxID=2821104 RepID=UPI001ADA2295|nr:UvrD-helicase domain-containing protein [Sulfitobacter sp. R18_1]MBO9428077.1 DEAD/DEAH box helicase [Sulfitobacter sp. R18_1]
MVDTSIEAYQRLARMIEDARNLSELSFAIVIAATAGSGKTYTITNLTKILISAGIYRAQDITMCSFTNAASAELRKRCVDLDPSDEVSYGQVRFTTLDSLVTELAKAISPVITDVGGLESEVYFPASKDEDLLLATIHEMLSAYQTVAPKGATYDSILNLMRTTLPPKADALTIDTDLNDVVSNSGPKTPEEIYAKVCLALVKICKRGIDPRSVGIPKFLVIDEAQDCSLHQVLLAFFMMRCGTDVVFIGDHLQTLYRFRDAVGSWIFTDEVISEMATAFGGRQLDAQEVQLPRNRRCAKNITNAAAKFAEEVPALVDRISSHSWRMPKAQRDKTGREHFDGLKRFVPFQDPEKGTNYGQPFEDNKPGGLFVLEGTKQDREDVDNVIDDDVVIFDPIQILNKDTKVSSGSLAQVAMGFSKEELPQNGKAFSDLGGQDFRDHLDHIVADLKRGASVAFLAPGGWNESDRQWLLRMHPDLDETEIRVHSSKNCLLKPRSWYSVSGGKPKAAFGIPTSCLLASFAMTFFLTPNTGMVKASGQGYVDPIKNQASRRADWERAVEEKVESMLALQAYGTKEAPLFEDQVLPELAPYRLMLTKAFSDMMKRMVRYFGELYGGEDMNWVAGSVSELIFSPRGVSDSALKIGIECMYKCIHSTTLPKSCADLSRELEKASQDPSNEFSAYFLNDIQEADRLGQFHADIYSTMRRRSLVDDEEPPQSPDSPAIKVSSSIWANNTRNFYGEVASVRNALLKDGVEKGLVSKITHALNGRRGDATIACVSKSMHRSTIRSFAGDVQHVTLAGNTQNVLQPTSGILDLATIHGSKGLEWSHVVLVLSNKGGNETDAQSYRDLLYVASTRACSTLSVVAPKACFPLKNKILGDPKDFGADGSIKSEGALVQKHMNALFIKSLEEIGLSEEWEDDFNCIDKKSGGATRSMEITHSQIERVQTCIRSQTLSEFEKVTYPMGPSYQRTLHRMMASICASLAGILKEPPKEPPYFTSITDILKQHPNETDWKVVLEALQKKPECFQYMAIKLTQNRMALQSEGSDIADAILRYIMNTLMTHVACAWVGSEVLRAVPEAAARGDEIIIERFLRNSVPGGDVMSGATDLAIISHATGETKLADWKVIPTTLAAAGQKSFEQADLYSFLVGKHAPAAKTETAELVLLPAPLMLGSPELVDHISEKGDLTPPAFEDFPEQPQNSDWVLISPKGDATYSMFQRVRAADLGVIPDIVTTGSAFFGCGATNGGQSEYEEERWLAQSLGEDGREPTAEDCMTCEGRAHCSVQRFAEEISNPEELLTA